MFFLIFLQKIQEVIRKKHRHQQDGQSGDGDVASEGGKFNNSNSTSLSAPLADSVFTSQYPEVRKIIEK